MPKQKKRLLTGFASKVHLQVISELCGGMHPDFPAQLFKTRGEHGSHAIYRRFHVARGLEGNELFDGVKDGGSLLVKVAKS
jgi:hypothetical protein